MKVCEICGATSEETTVYSGKKYDLSFLCNKHYNQMKSKGFIKDPSKPKATTKKVCDICGDDNKVWKHKGEGERQGNLLCTKHRSQLMKYGELKDSLKSHRRDERICSHCGESDGEIIFHQESRKMLCRRHYDQLYVYGEIMSRTVFDRNEIVEYDDYAEVIVYKGKKEFAKAIIDNSDVELASRYKWGMDGHGYLTTKVNGRYLALHQLLMNTKNTDYLVDHKDRNKLNNRRSNLRIANKSINTINTGIRKHNNSGITGVSFQKQSGKWRAYITYNKKRIELGQFINKEDAIKARLEAERDYFKEYAPQRDLFNQYGILEEKL
ncbi:HNH endonuclease [Priestia megaterium]|uniref:HNH endonuclease n=1 Tax=Priestia megaterium TaxID=1404 RepID=UPI002FFF7B00